MVSSVISVGIYGTESIRSIGWPHDETSEECWCGCGRRQQVRKVCDNFLCTTIAGKKLWQRIDRFTAIAIGLSDRLALLARELALPEEIGVFVGNELGGWTYAVPQLANLKKRGWRHVSPFQATAWFPAAPQGEITIRHDLRGLSKTFSTKALSGLESLYFAAMAISLGRIRFALAGAVEVPTNSFASRGIFGCPKSIAGQLEDTGAFLLLGTSRPGLPTLSIGPVVRRAARPRRVTEFGGAVHLYQLLRNLEKLPLGGRYEASVGAQSGTASYVLESQ